MEERRLYPLKFIPETASRPWGGVSYLLADLGFADTAVANGWLGGNTISEVMETYLERVSGEKGFEYFGTQFPVAVRALDVGGRTSLRVNPDDETARVRYDTFGRPALWIIEKAGPGAELCLGFKEDTAPAAFYDACLEGRAYELLHKVVPVAGEVYPIPPGMVHAAFGPVRIVEISEASGLFFRLMDPSGGRETHLEEAFDLIDFRRWSEGRPEDLLPLRIMPHTLEGPEMVENGETGGFTVYYCRSVSGAVSQESFGAVSQGSGHSGGVLFRVPSEDGRAVEPYTLRPGEVLLVPDDIPDYTILPAGETASLIEVRI